MIRTREECEAFLAERGLATVLPAPDALLPCLLWEVRGHRERGEWDEPFERTWTWKDDLPAAHQAFAGRLFGDRVVLLHRSHLPAFLAWRGMPDPEDLYGEGHLGREALRVARALEDGPAGRTSLRRATGLSQSSLSGRFDRACRDLERRLLVTRAGRAPAAGWDANRYALVREWFPAEFAEARTWDPEAARDEVRRVLQAAAPEATPRHLQRWMREP